MSFLSKVGCLQIRFKKNIISLTERKDGGVREAGFCVLRKTAMPSVLIELGFLSNDNERKFLTSGKGADLMAQSIFSSVSDYKQRLDARSGKSSATTSADKASNSKSTSKQKPAKVEKDVVQDTAKIVDAQSAQGSVVDVVPNQSIIPDTLIDVSSFDGRWYGTQIMSINVKYEKGDSIFKNQGPVYYLSDNGIFKYFLNVSQNSKEVLKKNKEIRAFFPDAFPIGIINGKRTSFTGSK